MLFNCSPEEHTNGIWAWLKGMYLEHFCHSDPVLSGWDFQRPLKGVSVYFPLKSTGVEVTFSRAPKPHFQKCHFHAKSVSFFFYANTVALCASMTLGRRGSFAQATRFLTFLFRINTRPEFQPKLLKLLKIWLSFLISYKMHGII